MIAAGSCAPGTSQHPPPGSVGTASGASRQATALADEYFAAYLQAFPISGTFYGVPNAAHDRLDDNSLTAVARWERHEDDWLARVRRIDGSALRGSPAEATFGILRETLEASYASRVCHRELWPLDQQNGFQILFPDLAVVQPVGSPKARADAVARWHAIPRYIDVEIANLREGVRRGYTQPLANVQAVIEQLDDLKAATPEKSPFAALIARDSTAAFRQAIVRIVETEIHPALTRYRAFLATEYLPHSRASTAIRALPNGEACYQALIRVYTTLDVAPDSIYALGIAQMTQIDSAMRAIATQAFGATDLAAFVARVREDTAYKFRTREEIIRTADAAIARAKAAIPQWFGQLPRAELIVDPCEPFEEKSGCPNSYLSSTPDGSRPGRWRINAGDPTNQPRAPLEGIAFHEGSPGHHLQDALAIERSGAHPLTQFFGFAGFSEGWALYAEHLAIEMGLYSSPLYVFGEWGEQALRAARLVVDPGLHIKGWTRQQAIDYMLVHVPESRASIESEVDRYIASPGQATAYMLGRLEIERLRRAAEARLGSKFDIRTFHDWVLANGSIPLPLLREVIETRLAHAHS